MAKYRNENENQTRDRNGWKAERKAARTRKQAAQGEFVGRKATRRAWKWS